MPRRLTRPALLIFTIACCGYAAKAGNAGTSNQFERWREQIRRTLYVPARLPALEPRIWSSLALPVAGGVPVTIDHVTYQTADGMLVPAVVYRPQGFRGKLPGIVVVNGHGGDKFTWYAVYSGLLFAQAGAEVVTYDPIGEGERNASHKSHAGAHDKIWTAPDGAEETEFQQEWGRHLAGLMQVDAMQAVSYLRQRPEVDPNRIGLVGYSMGAFVSGITGAIDPRIHAVLLSGGGTYDDLADGGKSFDSGKLPCQAPPWLSLRVLGSESHRRGAVLYALNAQRGPMLVVNGSLDEVMDIPHRGPEWFAALRQQAVALDRANGGNAANMFTTHFDDGKGHRTAWVERPEVAWLNQQLHFARWTSREITDAPVTHASDWIRVTHSDISPNYLREDREGGLMALGADLPAVSREQLTVLKPADWELLKSRLTYENWAAATMARLQRDVSKPQARGVSDAQEDLAPPQKPVRHETQGHKRNSESQ